MPPTTRITQVELPNGKTVLVEAVVHDKEQDISRNQVFSIEGALDIIRDVAEALADTLEQVKPNKVSVEFGLSLAVKSGALTALIMNGSGEGSLKIALEWNSGEKPAHSSSAQ
jgi:hypothetical protein